MAVFRAGLQLLGQLLPEQSTLEAPVASYCLTCNDLIPLPKHSAFPYLLQPQNKLLHYLDIIEREDILPTKEIELLFAPTGCIQETAIDNDWSDQYMQIADQIDRILRENT